MLNSLLLATADGHISPDHIAADLSFPLGVLFFSGSVYVLLWSIYGAKKGALIYSVAFFGFTMVLGVFWWFGAPGTPVATGPQNFPGQTPDHYVGKWYAMEPGSERAAEFPSTSTGEGFADPATYLEKSDLSIEDQEADLNVRFITGDIETASGLMKNLALPVEDGTPQLGASRRAAINEAAGGPQPRACASGEDASPACERRAGTFLSAQVVPGTLQVRDDVGHRVARAEIEILATFVSADADGKPVNRVVSVDRQVMYAFKDAGALWFPAAVFTLASLLIFAVSLWALDRMEQAEKREDIDAEEPMDIRATAGV